MVADEAEEGRGEATTERGADQVCRRNSTSVTASWRSLAVPRSGTMRRTTTVRCSCGCWVCARVRAAAEASRAVVARAAVAVVARAAEARAVVAKAAVVVEARAVVAKARVVVARAAVARAAVVEEERAVVAARLAEGAKTAEAADPAADRTCRPSWTNAARSCRSAKRRAGATVAMMVAVRLRGQGPVVAAARQRGRRLVAARRPVARVPGSLAAAARAEAARAEVARVEAARCRHATPAAQPLTA